MIKIIVNDSEVLETLGAIEGMTATVKTSQFTGPMLKRIHSDLTAEFDEVADTVAATTPANFHHVYEWRMVGVPQGRLWKHRLVGHGNNRVADFNWKASRAPILTPKERASNPNDPMSLISDEDIKRLSGRKYVFYWKAPVMEYNLRVNIVAKNSPKKLLFIPTWSATSKGKNFRFAPSVNVSVPGGGDTTGMFSGLWATWWRGQAPQAFDRKIKKEIEKEIGGSVLSSIRKRKKTVGLTASNAGAFNYGMNRAEKDLLAIAKRRNRGVSGDL